MVPDPSESPPLAFADADADDRDRTIAELEAEIDRLERELDAQARKHEAVVSRYERLLAERTAESEPQPGLRARLGRWFALATRR